MGCILCLLLFKTHSPSEFQITKDLSNRRPSLGHALALSRGPRLRGSDEWLAGGRCSTGRRRSEIVIEARAFSSAKPRRLGRIPWGCGRNIGGDESPNLSAHPESLPLALEQTRDT